jgi:NADPH-dependent glutamate synthase beta subunit-like oxidoreductase
MGKIIVYKSANDVPYLPVSGGKMDWNKTGNWSYVKPIHSDNTPPCNNACPAGENIQGYLQLVLKNKYRQAWELIRERNPLPAVCGRVCYHPCEANCNRGQFDEAVSVHCVERFLGDWGIRHGKLKRVKPDKSKGEIAVIGSGPAGLSTAYHLARMKYKITIFEGLPQPGGMLRVGIPRYRLPREILDAEIKSVLDLGINLKLNTHVGKDIPFPALDKYRAIFIGVGAHKGKSMGIEGQDLPVVGSGLEFLSGVNAGKRVSVKGKVAVIGGGNTAVDVARCVLRKGGTPVIVYRRSIKEMPAIPEEVHEAEMENIEIMYLHAPVTVKKSGRSAVLTLTKMKLTEADESGRRRPVPIKGSEFKMKFSMVLTAIGEDPDLSFLEDEVEHFGWGINNDPFGCTNNEKVFAGGDAGNTNRAVSDAIGSGYRAALAIDHFLRNEKLNTDLSPGKITEYKDLNVAYFNPAPPGEKEKISLAQRVKSFKEVNIGYGEEQTLTEAKRCFSCGVCNACDNCWVYCPDIATSRQNGQYIVNYDFCKGCGICVRECPRDAIYLEYKTK